MHARNQESARVNPGRAKSVGCRRVFKFLPGVVVLFALNVSPGPRVAPMAAGVPPGITARTNEAGVASYYGAQYQGKPTASGEIFDMEKMTAAHRRLAFGTKLKVTRRDTGKTVEVRVNDRGPFITGRVVDLSLAAARELQILGPGLAEVELEVIH